MSEIKKGKFSNEEEQYIRSNYLVMTDKDIARALNRNEHSVKMKRSALGLNDKRQKGFKNLPKKAKKAMLASMTEDEREKLFAEEIKKSPWYKQIKKVLANDELRFYEQKYIAFMMDPTIETMTVAERDALHEMTMAQIRSNRYMKEERNSENTGRPISRAQEIKACSDTIQKNQEILNVQRKQRLKDKGDLAKNLSQMIRELKDPNIRREVGYEAAMMKYITERHYNHAVDNGNIHSGKSKVYNLAFLFKDRDVPDLDANFFQEENEEENRKTNNNS